MTYVHIVDHEARITTFVKAQNSAKDLIRDAVDGIKIGTPESLNVSLRRLARALETLKVSP